VASAVGKLSCWDTLRFLWWVSAPAYCWGLAAPNRLAVRLLVRWHVGESTVRFLTALRREYRSSYLRLWFPFGATLVVMHPQGMDAVLASSDNVADPKLKKRTLSQFVPDALVVSSGAEWRVRRDFNEGVLQFGHALHRHADAFLQIIAATVARFADEHGPELRWTDFEALAEQISHQVLLGQGQVDPAMTSQLARVVKRSNVYVLPRDSAAFAAFYALLDAHLAQHGTAAKSEDTSRRCLMADSAEAAERASAAPPTSVPSQIGFWFYVIKDALEINVSRTLALIAAHHDVYEEVQREIAAVPMATLAAQAIDGLHFLESCIGEQLRLWTPVPILLRRTVNAFSLPGDIAVDAGEQILIHAGFYHRDVDFFGEAADKFSPRRRADDTLPRVYSFSAGRQSCAGQFVARFLLKATLALLLARFRFELIDPGIDAASVPYQYDHFKLRFRISSVM
jgi:cytochrome P450